MVSLSNHEGQTNLLETALYQTNPISTRFMGQIGCLWYMPRAPVELVAEEGLRRKHPLLRIQV